MTNFEIKITYWWLLLLLVPAVVLTLIPYFRMNKRYRRNRNRVTSIVLHLLVMTLCVFTLAGVSFEYDTPNTENEILILLDSSFSSRDAEATKEDIVSSVIDYGGDDYKIGIVKFGYDQVYAAPLSNDSRDVYRRYLASDDPDTSATDIEAALRYASSLVAHPETAKIVLVSDGVETDGKAMSAIRRVAAQGTKVDVIPLASESHDELQITGIDLPEANITEGAEFTFGVRIKSNFGGTERDVVNAVIYDNGERISSHGAFLVKGEQTVNLKHTFETRGFHELKIEVSSETPNGDVDTVRENNTYYTYVYLAEYDNILILEKSENESAAIQKALSEDMEKTLTVYTTDNEDDKAAIPSTLEKLAEYDQVILVNIANSDMPDGFSKILFDYVNRLGGSLFTVGGKNDIGSDGKLIPHAYSREDMAAAAAEGDTYYQQLLPVQAIDYTPPVAIVALIDTSGSMSDKIQACKDAAIHLLDQLNTWDYFGASTFYDESKETVEVLPVSKRDDIAQRIYAISNYNAGGTSFASGVNMAADQLASIDAPSKHIIFFTDGQPGDMEEFAKEAKRIYEESKEVIKVSVAVAGGGGDPALADACKNVGGEYLYGSDYSSIAYDIFKSKMVEEIKYGEPFHLLLNTQASPVTKGLTQEEFNAIDFTGYYGTRLKDGAQAPISAQLVPMYAHWTVGNGTVGSFMCDWGGEWSKDFPTTDTGKKLLTNIVTSLFPSEPISPPGLEVADIDDNYGTQLNVYAELPEGGSVSVEVTPVSAEAKAIYGDEKPTVTEYDGGTRFTFCVRAPGVYKADVRRLDSEGKTVSSYTVYKTLAYSAEYNVLDITEGSGEERLASIAEISDGIVAEDIIDVFASFVKTVHKYADPRIVFLIAAIVLFLLDIAVRKFKFKWIHELVRDRKAEKALSGERK